MPVPPARLGAVALLLMSVLPSLLSAQTATPPRSLEAPLTSEAIDKNLFREGAIRRFSGRIAAWSYVCDEVSQLHQRFCSLRSTIADEAGTALARLTVSTGENGKPAGLLEIAHKDITDAGLEVIVPMPTTPKNAPSGSKASAKPGAKAETKAAEKAKPPPPYKVYPAGCSGGVCQLIWTLTAEHIEALNTGNGLTLRFANKTASSSPLASALSSGPPTPREVKIDANGFAAAVEASMKPGK